MIAAAIAAQMPPSVPLYGILGASRDYAARAIKAIQNAGFTHLAKTDIRDCFQSVDPDALYSLPLPQEVIRTCLDPRNLTYHQMNVSLRRGPWSGSLDFGFFPRLPMPRQ